jgi:hypothetical protein
VILYCPAALFSPALAVQHTAPPVGSARQGEANRAWLSRKHFESCSIHRCVGRQKSGKPRRINGNFLRGPRRGSKMTCALRSLSELPIGWRK